MDDPGLCQVQELAGMEIVLSVIGCPGYGPPGIHRQNGGQVTIGRDPLMAQWVLPDPTRQVSRAHCLLRRDHHGWQVRDLSSNGTFLNGEPEPLQSRVRLLRDGDHLRLGPYEVAVGIRGDGAEAAMAHAAPACAVPVHAPPVRPPLPAGAVPPHAAPPLAAPGSAVPQSAAPQSAAPESGVPESVALVRAALDRSSARMAAAGLPAQQPSRPSPDAAHTRSALAAFLSGAGLESLRPADAGSVMRNAGAALRAFVTGLREVLAARAEVKEALSLGRSIIRAQDNNPLDFSVSDEDALLALLGIGRRIPKPAADTVLDAMRDVSLHEQAMLPAMQDSVRKLVARLDPAVFESAEQGGFALNLQRRLRALAALEAEYDRVALGLAQDFEDSFGRSFAAEYNRVISVLRGPARAQTPSG